MMERNVIYNELLNFNIIMNGNGQNDGQVYKILQEISLSNYVIVFNN